MPTTCRRQRRRRRPPAADLHVLPPGARGRGAGRADAAHARRPDDRRDRPRVPRARADDGAAARARQAQDPQRRHPVPRPARAPAARAHRARCSPCSTCCSTRATPRSRGRRPRPRADLCAEAIRLARMLAALMPDEPEALGLLALMLLHDARRTARVDDAGDLVPARGPGPHALGRTRRSPRASAVLDAALRRGPARPVSGAGRDRRVPRDRADAGDDRLGTRSPRCTASSCA